MTDRRAATAGVLIAIYSVMTSAVAHADPKLIECPDHSHVWHSQQCDKNGDNPFGGLPGGGGGGPPGGGGLLGVVGRVLGGLRL